VSHTPHSTDATLAEVQRLLASNHFATIQDLASHPSFAASLDDVTDDDHGYTKAEVVELIEPMSDASPLPRRRSA
jgi:hypothetical protein